MRYRRKLTKSDLAKEAMLKTKALPTHLAVLGPDGKKWVLPWTLESLAKENKCSQKLAIKMFQNVACMCKMGLLVPAQLGAIAA